MRTVMMLILVTAGTLISVTALAGPPAFKPVDVRDLMSVTQFDQTGLNKLSPGELAALNAWLNRYMSTRAQAVFAPPVAQAVSSPAAAVPAAATRSAAAGFGADTMAPRESADAPRHIETRIAGLFTGWTGDTVFPLENGQVWKQAASGYYTDTRLNHPRVVIKKLVFGYLLTLPGHSETVFVRRIK